jgi:lipopolysaccharide/colanic/teichoic acid biosynthesis glycosyltransferase
MTAVEQEQLVTAAPTVDRPLWAVPTVAPIEPTLAYHSWQRHMKRTIDIAVVVLLLPIALPLMLLIAVAVKCVSRGPVLFRHQRIGRNGQMFGMLKFRTMYVDAAQRLEADPELYASYVANDYKLAATDDPRIVPLGRFLRRTSLDELPQLFNVLWGQMSLVGPRPIVAGELECYGSLANAYLGARPGITGRWQCEGRNHIRYPERAMLDADYVETWSLWRDVVILLKTIPCVLRRHGSH